MTITIKCKLFTIQCMYISRTIYFYCIKYYEIKTSRRFHDLPFISVKHQQSNTLCSELLMPQYIICPLIASCYSILLLSHLQHNHSSACPLLLGVVLVAARGVVQLLEETSVSVSETNIHI